MKIFRKDLRKEYLKMIGLKYGKEEKKEIKAMLRSGMPLDVFKLCVTPIIDEKRLREIGNTHIELKKIAKDTIIYLKAEQMKQLKKKFEEGLKYEDIELYKRIVSTGTERSDVNSKNTPEKEDLMIKDSDRDGITDFEEIYVYDTDKERSDTDGDGKTDQEEVMDKSNPRDAKKIDERNKQKTEKKKSKKKEKELER